MDAPIFSFGEIRGALGVFSREAGRFEESDLRLIEAFASLALDRARNAEAYEESVRQTRVERGFYRIAAVLSEPLSEQETLDAVAQAAAEALGGNSAAVLRAAGDGLELAACTSSRRRWARTRTAAPRSSRASAAARCSRRGGSARTSASGAAWARLRPLPAAARSSPCRSAGRAGRSRARARLLRGERTFGDDQLELAGQVAARRAGALERSELFERERRSRHLAQHLALAGRELAAKLDPDDVLDEVARHAKQLLDADGACARARGRRGRRSGRRPARAPRRRWRRARSTAWLVGDLVQTRATRAIADASGDPRVAEADAMLAAGYVGYLGVPMLRAGGDGARHPRRLLAAAARVARGGGRSAARARRDRRRGAPTPTSTRASATSSNGEAILANVADGSWRSTATAASCSGTRRRSASPASCRRRSARPPTKALGRPLDAAGGTLGGSRRCRSGAAARRSGSRSARR